MKGNDLKGDYIQISYRLLRVQLELPTRSRMGPLLKVSTLWPPSLPSSFVGDEGLDRGLIPA